MNVLNAIKQALTPSAPPAQAAASGATRTVTVEREVVGINSDGPVYLQTVSETRRRIKETRVRKTPRPYASFGHVAISPRAVANAIKLAKATVVSPAEREQLADLDSEYERIVDFAKGLNRDGAKAAFQAQQADLRKRLKAGKGREVKDEDSWSVDDFREDFEVKRKGANDELRRIVAEASPITLRIRDRIGEAGIKATAKLEAEERERAGEWDMPHCPSNILIAVGRLSWNLDWLPVCVPGMTAPRPSEILKVVDGLSK